MIVYKQLISKRFVIGYSKITSTFNYERMIYSMVTELNHECKGIYKRVQKSSNNWMEQSVEEIKVIAKKQSKIY